MQQLERLNVGASGTDYYFTENENLLKYLQDLYPQFSFEATLSLSAFPQRNLHQLDVSTPVSANGGIDALVVEDAIVEGLLNFLDRAREDMHRNGVKSAKVHLSRISIGKQTDALSLKTQLYAHLRACFIPG